MNILSSDILQISQEEFCIHVVNYTVVVETSNGMEAQRYQVDSSRCANGTCSTSFSLLSSNETYKINLTASNMFGSSIPTTFDGVICMAMILGLELTLYLLFLDGSIGFLFNHTINSEDCITTASCSTTLSERGNCTIQYGKDPFYLDLGPPISGPLNSSFSLPRMETSTRYYVQVTFTLNSNTVVLRENITLNGNKRMASFQ